MKSLCFWQDNSASASMALFSRNTLYNELAATNLIHFAIQHNNTLCIRRTRHILSEDFVCLLWSGSRLQNLLFYRLFSRNFDMNMRECCGGWARVPRGRVGPLLARLQYYPVQQSYSVDCYCQQELNSSIEIVYLSISERFLSGKAFQRNQSKSKKTVQVLWYWYSCADPCLRFSFGHFPVWSIHHPAMGWPVAHCLSALSFSF